MPAIGSDFSLDLLLEASDLDSVPACPMPSTSCGIAASFRRAPWTVRLLPRPSPRRCVRVGDDGTAIALHHSITQGLELLYAGRLEGVASQLAEQYLLGGRPDRALTFFRQAADQATAVFANAEAIRQHRRCLELIRDLRRGVSATTASSLTLQSMSAPLNALQGYGSIELQAALQRSVTLADRLGRRDVLVRNLVGLFAVRRSRVTRPSRTRSPPARSALSGDDTDIRRAGFRVRWLGESSLGMLETAIEHFDIAIGMSPELSVALVVSTRPRCTRWRGRRTRCGCSATRRRPWPDPEEAVVQGRSIGQPYTLAVALGVRRHHEPAPT